MAVVAPGITLKVLAVDVALIHCQVAIATLRSVSSTAAVIDFPISGCSSNRVTFPISSTLSTKTVRDLESTAPWLSLATRVTL